MQPLLKIQTIPISIEYKVKRAALEYQSTPAKVQVTRNRGSLNIQTRAPRLNIDSFEARASMGNKSPARSVQEFASGGVNAAYQATRTIAEDGNSLVDSRSKTSIADLAANKLFRNMSAETMTAFIPSVRPEVSVDPGSISFDFTMDKLSFDWNINHKPQLEFVPGNLEFSVAQYPDVVIEYVGSPIYVPRSADPNYEPPAIDASV